MQKHEMEENGRENQDEEQGVLAVASSAREDDGGSGPARDEQRPSYQDQEGEGSGEPATEGDQQSIQAIADANGDENQRILREDGRVSRDTAKDVGSREPREAGRRPNDQRDAENDAS